mmetsp:Transcript_18379/g.73434  ORF Transcript_18379/g.73434 Transcript_18379/m.73434 type:complete len:268 (-) Transcript_18379:17-820(-)
MGSSLRRSVRSSCAAPHHKSTAMSTSQSTTSTDSSMAPGPTRVLQSASKSTSSTRSATRSSSAVALRAASGQPRPRVSSVARATGRSASLRPSISEDDDDADGLRFEARVPTTVMVRSVAEHSACRTRASWPPRQRWFDARGTWPSPRTPSPSTHTVPLTGSTSAVRAARSRATSDTTAHAARPTNAVPRAAQNADFFVFQRRRNNKLLRCVRNSARSALRSGWGVVGTSTTVTASTVAPSVASTPIAGAAAAMGAGNQSGTWCSSR